jgi:SAM-dependent methyltransferase
MSGIDVEAFREFERRGWEEVGAVYADAAASLTIQCAEVLLDLARVGPGSTVVDVACGPGDVAAAATRRGAQASGVDVAVTMVELARHRHPGLDFVIAPAERLPQATASVDAAVSNFGLPHFADPPAVVGEFARVVRPGGRVALSTWCRPEKVPFFGLLVGTVQELGEPAIDGLPAGPDIFTLGAPDAATSFMAALGLSEVTVEEVPVVADLPADTDLVEFARANTVRTRALLDGQDAATLEAVRNEVRRRARFFIEGDRLVMPMPALVMAGTVGEAT